MTNFKGAFEQQWIDRAVRHADDPDPFYSAAFAQISIAISLQRIAVAMEKESASEYRAGMVKESLQHACCAPVSVPVVDAPNGSWWSCVLVCVLPVGHEGAHSANQQRVICQPHKGSAPELLFAEERIEATLGGKIEPEPQACCALLADATSSSVMLCVLPVGHEGEHSTSARWQGNKVERLESGTKKLLSEFVCDTCGWPELHAAHHPAYGSHRFIPSVYKSLGEWRYGKSKETPIV